MAEEDLLRAAKSGYIELVRTLLDSGANPNLRVSIEMGQKSPMQAALSYPAADFSHFSSRLKTFIKYGGDIKRKYLNPVHSTVRMISTKQGKDDLNEGLAFIDFLLEHGVPVTDLDEKHQTVLWNIRGQVAEYHKNNLELLKGLVSRGADINQINSEGVSYLEIAVSDGNNLAAEYLIKKGFIIKKERHPHLLYGAIRSHNPKILKVLHKNGIDLSLPDSSGNTPLITAVDFDWKTMINSLIKLNVDINAKGENGMTALLTAVSGEKKGMVKKILEAGADPGMQNDYGEDAIETAREVENKNIENIIESFISDKK